MCVEVLKPANTSSIYCTQQGGKLQAWRLNMNESALPMGPRIQAENTFKARRCAASDLRTYSLKAKCTTPKSTFLGVRSIILLNLSWQHKHAESVVFIVLSITLYPVCSYAVLKSTWSLLEFL